MHKPYTDTLIDNANPGKQVFAMQLNRSCGIIVCSPLSPSQVHSWIADIGNPFLAVGNTIGDDAGGAQRLLNKHDMFEAETEVQINSCMYSDRPFGQRSISIGYIPGQREIYDPEG